MNIITLTKVGELDKKWIWNNVYFSGIDPFHPFLNFKPYDIGYFNVTKVTCNHLFENPPKIIKTDKNTIYFVGECANYNKKVFLNYTY